MTPINPQSLFGEAECLTCYQKLSTLQMLRMALLRRIATKLNASADLRPLSIMDRAKCFLCEGVVGEEAMELALWEAANNTSRTPQQLVDLAECLECYSDSMGSLLILEQLADLQLADPYDNKLVYVQTSGAVTTIVNPVGAYNLNAVLPKITEVHCHNAPNITAITLQNDASLTVVDLKNCAALQNLSMNNNSSLASVNLDTFTTMDTVLFYQCASLQSFSASSLTTIAYLDLSTTPVTSLNINAIQNVTGFGLFLYSMPNITTMTFSNLITCGNIVIGSNPAQTYFSAPNLVSMLGGFNASTGSFIEIDLPLLETVNGGFLVHANPDLVTLTIDSLQTVGRMSTYAMPSLLAVSAPLMTDHGNSWDGFGCDSMTLLSAPVLTSLIQNTFDFSACPVMANIDMPSTLMMVDWLTASFDGASLNQSSVDKVIHWGTNGSITVGDIYLANGSNSAPSAAGILEANALITAGVNVYYNP